MHLVGGVGGEAFLPGNQLQAFLTQPINSLAQAPSPAWRALRGKKVAWLAETSDLQLLGEPAPGRGDAHPHPFIFSAWVLGLS